ncbi:hypothetical protein [Plantactinospora sp. BC1]|uniref:hypothetical protein n=1 Tax=Plantactinospora sp. BC1 TaxID=2108470 RepID=UPI00131F23A0|nr:hypothetical protein [Plantactinospora sp. BC1]
MLPETPPALPVVTEVVPDLTAGIPALTAVVPKLAAGVPVLAGAVPDVVAGVPLVLEALPEVVAGVPAAAERWPKLLGTVPEIVGSVPVVRDVPHGGRLDAPSPRLLADQPAQPAPAPAVPWPPVSAPAQAQPAAPVPVPLEPPTFSAPLRQPLDPGAGSAAGASRPSVPRAVARDTNPGLPSTPHPPVDSGAGTQQAGPTQSSGGQAAALPATPGWQPTTRSPSVLPGGGASPTGRSPGVPALPG